MPRQWRRLVRAAGTMEILTPLFNLQSRKSDTMSKILNKRKIWQACSIYSWNMAPTQTFVTGEDLGTILSRIAWRVISCHLFAKWKTLNLGRTFLRILWQMGSKLIHGRDIAEISLHGRGVRSTTLFSTWSANFQKNKILSKERQTRSLSRLSLSVELMSTAPIGVGMSNTRWADTMMRCLKTKMERKVIPIRPILTSRLRLFFNKLFSANSLK